MKSNMTQTGATAKPPLFDTILRIAVLFLLIAWCIGIILPFLEPVIWGAVIAVALYPLFGRMRGWVGNRTAVAGCLFVLLILIVLLLPTAWLVRSLVEGIHALTIHFRNQNLLIPPPDPSVANWPLVGKPISELWQMASEGIGSVIATYREPLSRMGITILRQLGGFGLNLILFFVSVLIAVVFILKADASAAFARKLIYRLAGDRGDDIIQITGSTIKNVVKGILGVAFFQFVTAGTVFMLAHVPLAGIWALAVLVFAILQLPAGIIILPVIIYLFSARELTPAILWSVVLLVIAISDNVLKPLLMGKGSKVPTLVVFLGVIGGFIFSGLIGLFTGAIVLSIGYNLLVHWIGEEKR